jgi:hypothetical protein
MEQGDAEKNQGVVESTRKLLEQLLLESRLYHRSRDYKELLDFVVKMRNFAPFNAMLLQLQKPGLRFASSKHDWKYRFNRDVKEGARPLVILWPFGPVAFVYDLEDTDGDPLPESVQQAFRASGEVKSYEINGYITLLAKNGIDLKLIAFGDAHAGHIKTGQGDIGLFVRERSTNTKELPSYLIRINSNHDPNVQFVTLIHELAHLYLGHLGPDKYLKIADRPRPNHDQVEVEAESVAYLVCKRNEVESKSEEYLANFVNRNPTTGNLDIYLILKAAGQIETILELGDMVSFGPRNK